MDEHLQSCPECLAEATKLHTAISSFAEAAREWSRALDSGEVRLGAAVRRAKRSWWRAPKIAWGLAAAMVVVIVVLGSLRWRHEVAQTEALNSVSDEVLMQQIDAEVSRRAPVAMEPLVQAITENTDGVSSTGANSDIHSQEQGETK